MTTERSGLLFHTATVYLETEVKRAVSSGTAVFSVTVAPEVTKEVDVPVCAQTKCTPASSSSAIVRHSLTLKNLKLMSKSYFAEVTINGYNPNRSGLQVLSCPFSVDWTVPEAWVSSE